MSKTNSSSLLLLFLGPEEYENFVQPSFAWVLVKVEQFFWQPKALNNRGLFECIIVQAKASCKGLGAKMKFRLNVTKSIILLVK